MIWKQFRNTIYSVSDTGLVRNDKRGKLKSQYNHVSSSNLNYKKVSLFNKHNKIGEFFVHRLVAEVFIPNPLKLPMVNHKDGNPENNNVSNLEWVSAKENVEHAIKVLHRQDRYKDACYKQHLVKLGEDFKQKHGIELTKFLEDERLGKIKWCYVEVEKCPIKENQRCVNCEHCFIAHDYEFTCELTHKTVAYDDGVICKHFKEEKEDDKVQ